MENYIPRRKNGVLILNEWILGRISGIPADFAGGDDIITKGERRARDRDHRTHSLVFDYYLPNTIYFRLLNRVLQEDSGRSLLLFSVSVQRK